MAWRRSLRSGLLLPTDRRTLNPGSPLADGLRSLWVPALGLTPDGLQNLVPDYPEPLAVGAAGTVPTFTSTDFGSALRFDGVDDYLVKTGSVYQPPFSFPATMAVVCRLDSIPTSTSTIYSFCSNNPGFTLELNVRTNRTRITFTGDANGTSTTVDIAANPTAGQVVMIVGTMDSYTDGRLSIYEPATGLFLTTSTTTGTTTNTAAANFLDYEVLGAWYGAGIPDSYTPVTILDAWFWGRSLSDVEIETWRRDRWSVLTAPARRTVAAIPVTSSTATSAQALLLPARTAAARSLVSARQTLTLSPVAQTAGSTRIGVAQQAKLLPPPVQTSAGRVIIRALQGTQGEIQGNAPVTLDSTTVRLDSSQVTLDAASVASYTGGTGLLLPAPTQAAHAKSSPSGLAAAQVLAVLVQATSLTAPSRVVAGQALSAVTQSATASAPNPGASTLTADQFLPPVSRSASTQVVLRSLANQSLANIVQSATSWTIQPLAQVFASQTLVLPTQAARAIPFVPPVIPGPRPDDAPVVAPEMVAVTGDLEDMIARQAAVLPPWWGAPGTVPPILRLPLSMAASVGSWIYDLIGYARLQTRIKTATDGWLDLLALDFFGDRIKRRAGQGDEAFRKRILVEMFRPRATRPAMVAVLKDLTGYEPRIFEPSRPQDVGGIGVGGGMGIGVSGAIGSIGLPGEVFIDAYRDPDFGIPYAAGIGSGAGGIGVPSRLVVTSLDQIAGALRDEDVMAAVEATRPVGIVAWVRISTGERKPLQ